MSDLISEVCEILSDLYPMDGEKVISIKELDKAYDKIINLRPTCNQLATDCISREAAINTVFNMCCKWNTNDPSDLKNLLMVAFQDLPSAEPERKKGTWTIEDCHAATYKYCCSICKAHHRVRYDFCPSCGADMRGEEDE